MDWYAVKRRFSIPIEDNEALQAALLRAYTELDLLSVYPHAFAHEERQPATSFMLISRLRDMLPDGKSLPRMTPAEWYAEHEEYVEEVLRKSRDVEATARAPRRTSSPPATRPSGRRGRSA
jgi:hypothetical protein